MLRKRVTRRVFLRLGAGTLTGMAVAAACRPAAQPAATPTLGRAAAEPTATPTVAPTATAAPTATPAPMGGTLVFATSVATPNLDPQMEITDARMRRSPLMYDTLVEWGDDFSIQPGLAESWDIESDTWVFRLRRGATFHNGKDVTADDVIYSMQRVFESPGKGFYAGIEEMRAPDKYTVEFVMSQANAPLLAALGGRYAFILPAGAAEEVDLKQTAVGSGAFRVKEFVQGQRLGLEKFEDYWNTDRLALDGITIQIVPDESTIIAGLRSGEIHLTVFEDNKNYLLIKDDPDIVAERWPAARWDVLDFPLGVEPFQRTKLRQAIASAIDREAIMQAAIAGLGTQLYVLPTALWSAQAPEKHPFFRRDLDKARRLLEESEVDTRDLTLVTIVGYSGLGAAAQVIAENLSEIGLSVEIVQEDLGIWIDKFLQGTFENFTMNSWGGWIDPDQPMYNHFHVQPEGKDFRGWGNEEISKLLDEARFTLDRAKREEVYVQIQDIIANEVPLIPLYSADMVTGRSPNVHNFKQHASSYYNNLRWVGLQG